MGKKSMKKVSRIAVAFLVVMMVFMLSGCEKLEDKFVKEMEAKVEKLETAAKAADSEGFDQINKEILSMRTNQEYAKLNADPDNSFSESNKNKISSLANCVEASRSELSTNVFIKNLDKLTTDLEAAIASQDSYNYAKLLCVDVQNLDWENIDQNEPVLLQPLERFRATLSAEMHYTLPENCLKFDLNSAGTGVIITGLQNWEQEFDYLFLDIPATIQGLPVKEIHNPSANRGWDDYGDREKNHYSVFYCSCRGISIPNGIEEIGIDAFSEFEGSTVQLPASLKKISDYAFYKSNIDSIVLPENLKEIGPGAFSWCKNLKEVVIPESVEKISGGAFRYSGIESLILPKNVSFVYSNTFQLCSNLKNVEIPAGVTSYYVSNLYGANNLCDMFDHNNFDAATQMKLKQIKLIEKK